MQPNTLLQQYRQTYCKYLKFQQRLERRIRNHTLGQLPLRQHNRLLRIIGRLKNRLLTLKPQLKWATAGAGLCLSIGMVEDIMAQAAGIPEGLEFQINTYTTGDQYEPCIAMDDDGDFVIAWNTSGADGSGYGVFARRYDKEGTAQGDEFQVNSFTTDSQLFPSVACDGEGNFMIVWTSLDQDGDSNGVFAQRYDALGIPQGGEFQVNTFTTGSQQAASVAMDDDGDFAITWQSEDGSGSGVFAQRYNAAGVAQGQEFAVNEFTYSSQNGPKVAMDSDGDFVITWMSLTQDGSVEGVIARRYDASGSPQGSEFQVNTYTTNFQRSPAIAIDGDGDFVIAWQSFDQDAPNSIGVYAQRYSATGMKQDEEFRVHTLTTLKQATPTVAMDDKGEFVIAWEEDRFGGSRLEVYAQRFDADGLALGEEFQANTFTSDVQENPAVALDEEGDFVIVWQSYGQDDSFGEGIYAQRFTSNNVTALEDDSVLEGVRIYPNPVYNHLQIDLQGTWSRTLKVNIMDVSGNIVLDRQNLSPSNGIVELDFTRYPPGLYVVQVFDGNRFYFHKIQRK